MEIFKKLTYLILYTNLGYFPIITNDEVYFYSKKLSAHKTPFNLVIKSVVYHHISYPQYHIPIRFWGYISPISYPQIFHISAPLFINPLGAKSNLAKLYTEKINVKVWTRSKHV